MSKIHTWPAGSTYRKPGYGEPTEVAYATEMRTNYRELRNAGVSANAARMILVHTHHAAVRQVRAAVRAAL